MRAEVKFFGMDSDRLTDLFEARQEGNVAILLDALRDPKYRFIAADHLGELRAQEAVGPLTILLRAGDTASRSSAAAALGKLRAREAVPSPIDLAREDEHIVPRTYGITALGAIGDDRAIDVLCEALDDSSILIRQSAARALGVLGHRDALEPLRNAAKRERWYSRRIHGKSIRRINSRSR